MQLSTHASPPWLGSLLTRALCFGVAVILGGCFSDVRDSIIRRPLGNQDESGASQNPIDDPYTPQPDPEPNPEPLPDPEPVSPCDATTHLCSNPAGGPFVGQVTVELATDIAGAVVTFTQDGTLPTIDSPRYTGPFVLRQTTQVRARLWSAGLLAAELAQVFIAVDPAATSFSSSLPVVVIHTQNNIALDPWGTVFVPGNVMTLVPDKAGRIGLTSAASLAMRAGLKVHGNSSRDFAQKSYAIELWDAGVDDDVDRAFLGMPAESDWILVAPSEMDKSLMRTKLGFDLSRRIGAYAPRTVFAEVFLVADGQPLNLNHYVGVYTATEKVKRGQDRVPVCKNIADQTPDPGGFIVRIDHGDTDFNVSGSAFQWVYPEPEDMALPERASGVAFLQGFLGEMIQSFYMPDGKNPTTGKSYTEYINRAQWIDHNILVAVTKNVDGLRLSAYFYKDFNGPVVAGPLWDLDRSMGTPYDDRATVATEWQREDGTHPLQESFWRNLLMITDFSTAYWQRMTALLQGPFAPAEITAMIDGYEAQLSEARARHFQRWPELAPNVSAANEVQILRDWYAARIPWLLAQKPASIP